MKIPTLIASLLITSLWAQQDSFIRQTMVVDGVTVTTDMPLDSFQGTMMSKEITADSALFELYTNWVQSDGSSKLMKLDDKSVASFLPTIDIATSSADPFIPTTTRADQPYAVTVTVSGLLGDANSAAYTNSVLVGRAYQEYSLVNHAPTSAIVYHDDAWETQSNGKWEQTNVAHRLPGPSTERVAGAEIYSVYLHPDSGLNYRLLSAEVIVWPVSFASITGLSSGTIYRAPPESGQVTITDAYPRSTNYVRIYKGAPTDSPTSTTTIAGTTRTFGTAINSQNVPQKTTIDLGSLANYMKDDGQYTVQVVTVTPFNNGDPEILASSSFSIYREIKVNANVVSAD